MRLDGSCHCGTVRFSLESHTPYPYMRCYCSICRKTAGGGGFAINLAGLAKTLEVHGKEHATVYRARGADSQDPEARSPAERRFCRHCGSALYVWDPRWPELVHPFASAIDTPLPVPPEHTHIMLKDKAAWVELPEGAHDERFEGYPGDSIEDWHRRRALSVA